MEEFEQKTDQAATELTETPEKTEANQNRDVFFVLALPTFKPIDLASKFADEEVHQTVKSLLRDLDEKNLCF